MRGVISWCVLAVSLAGCRTASEAAVPPPAAAPAPVAAPAPAPPPDATAAAPDRPIDLEFRVEARTKDGEVPVDFGQTLRSGDRLALYVKVGDPAWVYVGFTAPDGKRSVLAPSPDEPFPAGVERRIPAHGQWLKLARSTGREDIFVYASRTKLTSDAAMRLVAEDSARVRPAAGAKAVARRPAPAREDAAPGALTGASREIVLEGNAEAADRDLTKGHFRIDHKK